MTFENNNIDYLQHIGNETEITDSLEVLNLLARNKSAQPITETLQSVIIQGREEIISFSYGLLSSTQWDLTPLEIPTAVRSDGATWEMGPYIYDDSNIIISNPKNLRAK